MTLIYKYATGGDLYVVENNLPQILLRYASLLNRGIKPQAAFDTAHLSLVEDNRPGKYYSYGKRATNLKLWSNNVADSLTIGRYKNLLNVLNFNLFKQGLKANNYNTRPTFYNSEINRNRNKDKQIVNEFNRNHNIPEVASLYNPSMNFNAYNNSLLA